MANSKRKCLSCKKFSRIESGIVAPIGFFCSDDCRREYAISKTGKVVEKARKSARRIQKNSDAIKRKELMTRSQWYNKLQTLVNQYILSIRDAEKPCCTCGTTNPHIKYDAGHFFTKKARPDIRFDHHNIHKQCSVACNVHGSGMRAEYKDFIVKQYGIDELKRLEAKQKNLKDVFPTYQDIEAEIVRYRELIRSHGLKPNA